MAPLRIATASNCPIAPPWLRTCASNQLVSLRFTSIWNWPSTQVYGWDCYLFMTKKSWYNFGYKSTHSSKYSPSTIGNVTLFSRKVANTHQFISAFQGFMIFHNRWRERCKGWYDLRLQKTSHTNRTKATSTLLECNT